MLRKAIIVNDYTAIIIQLKSSGIIIRSGATVLAQDLASGDANSEQLSM